MQDLRGDEQAESFSAKLTTNSGGSMTRNEDPRTHGCSKSSGRPSSPCLFCFSFINPVASGCCHACVTALQVLETFFCCPFGVGCLTLTPRIRASMAVPVGPNKQNAVIRSHEAKAASCSFTSVSLTARL